MRVSEDTVPATTGYCVMVVDDDEDQRLFFELYLSHGGYEVLTAESAEDALAIINSERVDAIIADYRMPEMDGIDLLKALKGKRSKNSNSYKSDIPVMIVSAGDDQVVVEDLLSHGADSFCAKRDVRMFLLKKLSKLLNSNQAIR